MSEDAIFRLILIMVYELYGLYIFPGHINRVIVSAGQKSDLARLFPEGRITAEGGRDMRKTRLFTGT
jgi:hypothetical protein